MIVVIDGLGVNGKSTLAKMLANNIKARKVYELWGGKLSEYENNFVKLNVGYPEVFYTYDL